MKNRRSILHAALAVAALLTASAGHSRDIYVSPDGDDANDGSMANPLKDPVKAAALLQAGDTLLFRKGEYKCRTDAVVGLGPSRSGAEGRPITFRNYNNEHVKIDCGGSDWGFTPNGCSWIVIDGFEITNAGGYGMKISARHNSGTLFGEHVTVRNCEVHHTGNECLFAFSTPHLTIENCHMHDSARSHGIYINKGCHNLVIRNVTSENNRGNSGTQINAAGGGTKNGLVERCILRGNAQGFSLMGAIDCAFRNNIVVNNCFDGPRESGRRELILWTYAESKDVPGTICEGNIFENNTFVNTVPQGHTIEQLVHSKSGTKNCVFRNNIFVIRGKNVFRLESFDGFAFQNNCLLNIDGGQQVAGSGRLPAFATSNRLTESGTVEGDPLFADVANGDFRLKEGSPCIDAGVKTDNPASVAGRGRDIGALEKGAEALVGCRLTWRGDR